MAEIPFLIPNIGLNSTLLVNTNLSQIINIIGKMDGLTVSILAPGMADENDNLYVPNYAVSPNGLGCQTVDDTGSVTNYNIYSNYDQDNNVYNNYVTSSVNSLDNFAEFGVQCTFIFGTIPCMVPLKGKCYSLYIKNFNLKAFFRTDSSGQVIEFKGYAGYYPVILLAPGTITYSTFTNQNIFLKKTSTFLRLGLLIYSPTGLNTYCDIYEDGGSTISYGFFAAATDDNTTTQPVEYKVSKLDN